MNEMKYIRQGSESFQQRLQRIQKIHDDLVQEAISKGLNIDRYIYESGFWLDYGFTYAGIDFTSAGISGELILAINE
jgi:hypothetical protein